MRSRRYTYFNGKRLCKNRDYCKGIDEGFTECKGETEGRFGKDKIVAKYFEREALVRTVNLNVNNNVRGTLRHKVLAFKDGEIDYFL